MSRKDDQWGSDTRISMPVPVERHPAAPSVDLGGFIFTSQGLVLPANQALIEDRYTPRYVPKRGEIEGDL